MLGALSSGEGPNMVVWAGISQNLLHNSITTQNCIVHNLKPRERERERERDKGYVFKWACFLSHGR